MKEHIIDVIQQIEIDHDVKVLFACESGSRAWGFPSKDSDYDVRFIYIHKPEWYLSIDQKRDVMEIPAKDSISIPVDPLLDMSGWELTKALRLLRKSNPSILEWLASPIVYDQSVSVVDRMKELEQKLFSPVASLHHYINMAKGNFHHHEEGVIKDYLNVFRPLLAALWIEKYHASPQLEFQKLLEDLLAPGEVKDAVALLLKRKIAGEEKNLEPWPEVMNGYVSETIQHLEAYVKSLKIGRPVPTEELDRLFRNALREVWNEEWTDFVGGTC